MAQFDTQTDQMQSASKHVVDINSRIAGLLSGLRAEVATAPAHFHGAAATEFQSLMARYDEDAAKINKALAGIAEQLSGAGKDYSARDSSSAQALRGSGSGLNM